MSDVLIPIKGGGSVSSDELTAAMSDVLKGKTAVTSDSDDEAIAGTMPNLTADSTVGCSSDLSGIKVLTNNGGPWIYENTDGTSRMVTQYRGDNGYIQSNTMIGVAATNLGTTAADKVLSGYRFSSSAGINISGTMPNNSTTTSNGTVPGISSSFSAVPTREGTSLQLQTDTNGTKRISICPPQGYYPGPSNGGSYVNRPASDFGTATKDKVLSGATFTSEAGIKLAGTIAGLAGSTITPSSSQQTVSCSGKYMTGNIVINAIPSTYVNLSNCTVFLDGAFASGLGIAPNTRLDDSGDCRDIDDDYFFTGALSSKPRLPVSPSKYTAGFPTFTTSAFCALNKWIPKGNIKRIKVRFTLKGDGTASNNTYFAFVVVIRPTLYSTNYYNVYKDSFIVQGRRPKYTEVEEFTKYIDLSNYPDDTFTLAFSGGMGARITVTIKEISFLPS